MLHKLLINSFYSQSKHVFFLCQYYMLGSCKCLIYTLISKTYWDKMPLWFFLSLCKSAVSGLQIQIQYVTPTPPSGKIVFFFFIFFWEFLNHHQRGALAMPRWQCYWAWGSMWPTDVPSSRPRDKTSCQESGSAAAKGGRKICGREVTQVKCGSHEQFVIFRCYTQSHRLEDRFVNAHVGTFKMKHSLLRVFHNIESMSQALRAMNRIIWLIVCS